MWHLNNGPSDNQAIPYYLNTGLVYYSDPAVFRSCLYMMFLNFVAQVTLVMSVKVLQSEGQVMPISGKLCHNCKNNYDVKYGGKQTEKVVVFVPRTGKNNFF